MHLQHPSGDRVSFNGRILFLTQDPALIRAQLAGRRLSRAEAGALRDDVSTDEITPTTVMLSYDERLGRYPYVGLKAGGETPVGTDAVRRGGFAVTVAGKRYGKGSSRESSPLAERSAGIRLIVAESFERIYQQNCDNLGIFTSTDFALLDRILAGEVIPIQEFLRGRDALTQEIVRSGGLLAYSRFVDWPAATAAKLPEAAAAQAARPLTLAEKILARHLLPGTVLPERGQGVFVAADWRFSHDYFTGMCAHLMHQAFGEPASLHRPEQIIAFQDHLVFAAESPPHLAQGLLPGVAGVADGHRDFVRRYPVRAHHALPDVLGSEGICHALMTENYALPGEVVVGTDSHTPHAGALGCLAFGAGATEVANSWVTGHVRCKVPETVRIQLAGRLQPGVTAKDVVLHLLQSDFVRSGQAIGLVFEYGGSAVAAMSIDERATLTNMVAELGGFTGIVEPDAKVAAFLKERRGIDLAIAPWLSSDAGASYRQVIHIDAATLPPMLARPGDPGNGLPADALGKRVPVDIAYGGSCTAGKREDFDGYHQVLAWGLAHGLRVPPHTRLYLQFGTLAVRDYCATAGYLATFEQAGATLLQPGCGSCANCGPGASVHHDQVTISAVNRNFPGRSGPGQVWLASPYTVAASALAGEVISFERLQQRHA